MGKPIYKRILLKYSGAALAGNSGDPIDYSVVERLVQDIGELLSYKLQVAMVIGGGNLFRGRALSSTGVGRITADHIGMLSTLINALALRDAFEHAGYPIVVMSAIPIAGIVEHYDRRRAIECLQAGSIVLFAAGTGNPLVTTDAAASLRAIEVGADILLKGTQVDGVYSADPLHDSSAIRFKNLTYKEVLSNDFAVMDLAAFTQCRDHKMPIRVFGLNSHGALRRIVMGEEEGTLVN